VLPGVNCHCQNFRRTAKNVRSTVKIRHQKENSESFRRWLSIHVIFYFNPVFVPFRLLLYVEDNTNTVTFFKSTLLLNLEKYNILWYIQDNKNSTFISFEINMNN